MKKEKFMYLMEEIGKLAGIKTGYRDVDDLLYKHLQYSMISFIEPLLRKSSKSKYRIESLDYWADDKAALYTKNSEHVTNDTFTAIVIVPLEENYPCEEENILGYLED